MSYEFFSVTVSLTKTNVMGDRGGYTWKITKWESSTGQESILAKGIEDSPEDAFQSANSMFKKMCGEEKQA